MLEKLYKKAITILGDIKVFKWPFFLLYHPTGYKVTGAQIREVLDLVKPGDILLRGYNNYLDGYLIPGVFSHAGFYYGNNKVYHAMAEGVVIDDIIDFCRADYVAVLRVKYTTPYDIMISKKKANDYLGRPYDFWFNFTGPNASDFISCTELVNLIWGQRSGVEPKETKVLGFIKRKVIVADDYFWSDATKLIYIVNKIMIKFDGIKFKPKQWPIE